LTFLYRVDLNVKIRISIDMLKQYEYASNYGPDVIHEANHWQY